VQDFLDMIQNQNEVNYFQVPGNSRSGTGLRQAISKMFIEAQGVQISVDNDFGARRTFTLTQNKVSYQLFNNRGSI
jgi:hypothetical protein